MFNTHGYVLKHECSRIRYSHTSLELYTAAITNYGCQEYTDECHKYNIQQKEDPLRFLAFAISVWSSEALELGQGSHLSRGLLDTGG